MSGVNLIGQTANATLAGVSGENTGNGGVGVSGLSHSGDGVRAVSTTGNGLSAFSDSNVAIYARAKSKSGVYAISGTEPALVDISQSNDGVRAISTSSNGLSAFSESNVAVFAQAKSKPGVYTASGTEPAVVGTSQSNDGVRAISTSGNGLSAFSESNVAVFARAKSKPGVYAVSDTEPAVIGTSQSNDGVHANSTTGNGLSAFSATGMGIFAKGTVNAGFFEGNVVVTGDIQLTGADYAEDFDVVDGEHAEPGSVMVLDDAGVLRESHDAYDTRVAGVICGGGSFRPAVILDRRNDAAGHRVPVALMGKVYCKCKVDATYIWSSAHGRSPHDLTHARSCDASNRSSACLRRGSRQSASPTERWMGARADARNLAVTNRRDQ